MVYKKIAVVTGANSGLGYETSIGLAKQGFHVVLACRSEGKALKAAAQIKRKVPNGSTEFIPLDLVDRESIRNFAKKFKEKHDHLDLLINNAGVMGPPYTITPNGVELQFDANHLGHFLLTSLLVEPLYEAEQPRIVNLSSLAAKMPGVDIFFDNLNFEGTYDEGPEIMGLTGMVAYGQSKLANLLFAMELADRFGAAGKNIMALAAHPGVSNTGLTRNMPFMTRLLMPIVMRFKDIATAAEGAQPALYAALSNDVNAGDFIGPTGKGERTGAPGRCSLPTQAQDKELCAKLWTVSEDLLGSRFNI